MLRNIQLNIRVLCKYTQKLLGVCENSNRIFNSKIISISSSSKPLRICNHLKKRRDFVKLFVVIYIVLYIFIVQPKSIISLYYNLLKTFRSRNPCKLFIKPKLVMCARLCGTFYKTFYSYFS